MLTCPEAVCFWSLRDVLPAVEAGLVAEGLEVLHDLPHVLDRHDDEARGAEEEEAAGPGQAGRHGTNPADLSTSFSYFTVILHNSLVSSLKRKTTYCRYVWPRVTNVISPSFKNAKSLWPLLFTLMSLQLQSRESY